MVSVIPASMPRVLACECLLVTCVDIHQSSDIVV